MAGSHAKSSRSQRRNYEQGSSPQSAPDQWQETQDLRPRTRTSPQQSIETNTAPPRIRKWSRESSTAKSEPLDDQFDYRSFSRQTSSLPSDSLEELPPRHCVLSLDGGGVRGLSSLAILDSLMRKINPENPPKPCQVFDMIGGTSTGG
jgi:hypothetical protein